MKKTIIMFWTLTCILFLEGCTIGQKNDMQQNAESEVENNQVSESAPEMQVLERGNIANLGPGFLVCTVPGKEDEDYKLYFFSTESDSADIYIPLSEIEFDLEAADYVFPGVREGNVSIGRFWDIYFFDMAEIRDTDRDFVVIARYDVDGKNYYDTRAYMQSEKGYCVDEELMLELNEKYRDAEEYPIAELFMLPHD